MTRKNRLFDLVGPGQTRLQAIIGTLSHNRQFTAREISEYTRFDQFPIDGTAAVRMLKRLEYIAPSTYKRGQYYPTLAGWKWIESALEAK